MSKQGQRQIRECHGQRNRRCRWLQRPIRGGNPSCVGLANFPCRRRSGFTFL